MVCRQAPVIVLFVPCVAEVAQGATVGLPIDGFLLDVGVGITLLVPEGIFHGDVICIEEVKAVVLLKALRGFVPFQHFFLGDATGVVVDVIVLQVAVQEFLILHFEYGLGFYTTVASLGVISKVVCTVNGCCATTFTKEVIAMIAEITKVFIMVLFFKLYILFQVLVFGGSCSLSTLQR